MIVVEVVTNYDESQTSFFLFCTTNLMQKKLDFLEYLFKYPNCVSHDDTAYFQYRICSVYLSIIMKFI